MASGGFGAAPGVCPCEASGSDMLPAKVTLQMKVKARAIRRPEFGQEFSIGMRVASVSSHYDTTTKNVVIYAEKLYWSDP